MDLNLKRLFTNDGHGIQNNLSKRWLVERRHLSARTHKINSSTKRTLVKHAKNTNERLSFCNDGNTSVARDSLFYGSFLFRKSLTHKCDGTNLKSHWRIAISPRKTNRNNCGYQQLGNTAEIDNVECGFVLHKHEKTETNEWWKYKKRHTKRAKVEDKKNDRIKTKSEHKQTRVII